MKCFLCFLFGHAWRDTEVRLYTTDEYQRDGLNLPKIGGDERRVTERTERAVCGRCGEPNPALFKKEVE